ncbi:MAG TPA: UDP-2,3-diacylglucosamine diphosphatase LpxI [Longimicrobiaceae bacterium]|nr:UDP-2,3-diacylglucosamine diphosphatase LpxI [Longimicrobiaceae bacterium]
MSAAPIGLIAGSGRFPLLFAQAARRAGRSVVAVAHEGETDPALAAAAWVKLGQLGRIAEILRGAGVSEAVFCGGIRKPKLFDVRPDWLGLKALARLRSFGDDAALRAIASTLEGEGLRIVSPLPLVPELIVGRGPLGARQLSEEQRADALAGLAAARAVGQADIGQTVVVKRGVVLAVEAVEGTDACIARGGALGKGAVVVKARKPQQDDRFDVPAIGPRTVDACAAAGCSALAVEAGTTLALDRAELAQRADGAGIAVEGI